MIFQQGIKVPPGVYPKFTLAKLPPACHDFNADPPAGSASYLAQGFELNKGEDGPYPLQFAITAEYGYGTKTKTEEFKIDLRPYMGARMIGFPEVEELERIRKSMEKELKNIANKIK